MGTAEFRMKFDAVMELLRIIIQVKENSESMYAHSQVTMLTIPTPELRYVKWKFGTSVSSDITKFIAKNSEVFSYYGLNAPILQDNECYHDYYLCSYKDLTISQGCDVWK